MDFKQWNIFYKQIKKELPLNFEKDIEAANILDKLLFDKKNLSEKQISNLIKDKEIVIFGAGPSLEKSILKYKEIWKNKIILSVDGATTALKKYNILPKFIVSDLDGEIKDQIDYNKEDAIMVIHGHGDNIKKLQKYVPNFDGPVFGTTQTNPENYSYLHNYGGFTDGDRAVFLADNFNAKKIYLIGFDFDDSIGSFSFTKNKSLKLKKLKWCKKLIETLDNSNIIFLK